VTDKPGYLSGFILPTEPVVPTTVDGVDLYRLFIPAVGAGCDTPGPVMG
jgi:hypothetical protein